MDSQDASASCLVSGHDHILGHPQGISRFELSERHAADTSTSLGSTSHRGHDASRLRRQPSGGARVVHESSKVLPCADAELIWVFGKGALYGIDPARPSLRCLITVGVISLWEHPFRRYKI